MRLTAEELRQLLLPALVALVLLGAGAALIWAAEQGLHDARARVAAAQVERTRNAERLTRIAEEEREVTKNQDVYTSLKQLNILGAERRLEWADAIARIRTRRELLDLRYRVERQNLLTSVPGKPGSVDFFASTMHVQLALLHEQDLLHFLADLRESGNAYYSVTRCSMVRTGAAAAGAPISPRLRAECDIDLITIMDRGAK